MDLTQIAINGGFVTTLVGLLYKINDRRMKKLEDNKVNQREFDIIQDNNNKQLDALTKVAGKTHDAVIRIQTAMGIKEEKEDGS